MDRTFLYAKLHNVTVTGADRDYEGSFSIDEVILKASGILPNEQIHVYNITNGNRYVTYAIPAPANSKIMCANGACAHLTQKGDRVIICAYAQMAYPEWLEHEPRVLLFQADNTYRVKIDRTMQTTDIT